MQLQVIKSEPVQQESVSLKSPKPKAIPQYEADKLELAKSITQFDNKVKLLNKNPYDYNSISLKPKPNKLAPSPSDMVLNPLYNFVGKALGIDNAREWNKYYDKVGFIADWAAKKSGEKDVWKIIKWINSRKVASLGAEQRKIDQVYLYAKLER